MACAIRNHLRLTTIAMRRSIGSASFENIHQRIAGRARFYKFVEVKPVHLHDQLKYQIYLDGRLLRTPARNPMQFDNKDIALAIAMEWDAQLCKKRGIQPATMPIMTLVATAIDQIKPDPSHVRKTCLSYFPTDTALFWTTSQDRILLKKQRSHFEPVLRWLDRKFGLEPSVSKEGDAVGKLTHPPETLKKMEWMVNQLDPISLACLQCVTMECKSIVLALAYLGRYITLEQCIAASRIEEEFQVEIWGVVEGGHDMDRLNNAVAISSAGLLFGLHHSIDSHSKLLELWSKNIEEVANLEQCN